MKSLNFKLLEPVHLEEALDLLKEYGPDAELLAGGTDLLLDIRHGIKRPDCLISLTEIDRIAFVTGEPGCVRIGAGTSLHAVDQSPVLQSDCRMLIEGAGIVGSQQIRNLATIGGNICNAVPSADAAAPLLAADAQVIIRSAIDQRCVPLSDFFISPRRTVLQSGEMVTEFILPKAPPYTGSVYRRHTLRHALDLAMAGVAVSITMDAEGKIIQKARIAISAVAPTPRRAALAEELLTGNQFTELLLDEAAELCVMASSPISDVRASADYRKEIIRVLTKRCIRLAMNRSRETTEKGEIEVS